MVGLALHSGANKALLFHPAKGDVHSTAFEGVVRSLDELKAVHAGGLVLEEPEDEELGFCGEGASHRCNLLLLFVRVKTCAP
jgi:hypothetical protein